MGFRQKINAKEEEEKHWNVEEPQVFFKPFISLISGEGSAPKVAETIG